MKAILLLPAMGTWFCLLGSVLISEFSALSLFLVVKGWWDCGEVGKYICFLKDSVHGWWSKVSYSWTNPSSDWILIKSYHSFSLAQYLNFFVWVDLTRLSLAIFLEEQVVFWGPWIGKLNRFASKFEVWVIIVQHFLTTNLINGFENLG